MAFFSTIYEHALNIKTAFPNETIKHAFSFALSHGFDKSNHSVKIQFLDLKERRKHDVNDDAEIEEKIYVTYFFKLDEFYMLADKNVAMFDYDKMSKIRGYEDLCSFLSERALDMDNISFEDTHSLIEFIDKHNLYLYLNPKLSKPNSFGVFERLKSFKSFQQ